jgi:hypothetical protein
VTWNDVAAWQPEFAQWIVQTKGPLPDGDVRKEDFDRYAAEFSGESK